MQLHQAHFEAYFSGRSSLEQAGVTPLSLQNDKKRQAAVAVLLRFNGQGYCPEVLLMRRAIRKQDPWSGQVCLPGGKSEAEDSSLQETAVRETREELGLHLHKNARYLGSLETVEAIARSKRINMSISPHVFVQTQKSEIVLNEEAVHWFWLPLEKALQGDFDTFFDYEHEGQTRKLPAWDFGAERVWGLTFKMLHSLILNVKSSLDTTRG